MRLFAGIDIGTSGCRCVVLDERGERVAYGERFWSYGRAVDGFPALDPEDTVRSIKDAIADAAGACDGSRVVTLGVTSQRTGVVFLGPDGDELLISPNTDGRAAAEGIALERAHGETIYAVNGRLPALIYLPARLAWVRAHLREPTYALALSDWIVWRMTGARATEPTQAAEMHCFDLATGTWSEHLMEKLDVPVSLLPEILPSGTPTGELRDGWPFPAGIPVVAAGGDTQCSLLGVGATDRGVATVVAGTTMLAVEVVADPSIDPSGRLWTSPTPVAGRWVHEAHCGEAGAFVDWAAELMGTDPAGLAGMAERGQPGTGGVIAVDSQAGAARDFPMIRRAVLSFPAPVHALGRPREDVARAVFESVAFGAREGLDWLAQTDGEPEAIVATGGITRSSVFAVALAGASEQPVRVATDAASPARGAAIVAAAHLIGGLAQATAALRDPGQEVAPARSDGYPAHYRVWQEVSDEVRSKAITMKGVIG